ncbi:DNA cytosine methyltransferase [Rhizobium sp. MHM7A]|nr:DNA cytosine methyltransferase [Rhizobium sp. MHM7A]
MSLRRCDHQGAGALRGPLYPLRLHAARTREGTLLNVALHPHHLNILSICTGGGGLDLGVELAVPGARTVCMVEREAFAVAQLVSAMEAGLMAPAPVWSDARTFGGRAWRGAVDGVIGGIPCQPHSLAGKRLGTEDERDLWSDARRILVQSGAWFVLIENVGGMLSAGADEIAGAERVHRDLRKLGFEVEGGLFKAREVGATHDRPRVFILGLADARCPRSQGREWPRPSSERDRKAPLGPASEFRRASLADAAGDGCRTGFEWNVGTEAKGWRPLIASSDREVSLFPPGPDDSEGWRTTLSIAPELEPAFRRVADGLASRLDIGRVDRLRMLGNGVVPLQAAYALRTLVTRLAARGSAGAARLVRMMEEA